jgi:hypothetical protein
MTAPNPLSGTELIECARSNAKAGIEVAAHQCGYGNDIINFGHELTGALDRIGIKNKDFDDLLKTVTVEPELGIEVAPDTETEL